VICSNCGGELESNRILLYLDYELLEDLGIPTEPLCEACNQSKKEEDYRTRGKISMEFIKVISPIEKERLSELVNTIAENWPREKDYLFINRDNDFLVLLRKFYNNTEMLSLFKINENGSPALTLILNNGKTFLYSIDATINEVEEIVVGVLPLISLYFLGLKAFIHIFL